MSKHTTNRNATARKNLGITQHDMAYLLGISRSHLSLYELGERELPQEAFQIYAQFQMLAAGLENKATPPASLSPDAIKNLEYRLQECANILRKLDEQLKRQEQKLATQAALTQLMAFLEDKNSKQPQPQGPERTVISERARTMLREDYTLPLLETKIKCRVLAYEQELLREILAQGKV